LQLLNGLAEELVHGAADLVVGLGDALGIEVLANFTENVVIAGFLEIRGYHRLDIGLGLGTRDPQLFSGPLAEELVAPGNGPEPHFLVKGEFPLKPFLALVECRHPVSPLGQH